MTKEKTKWQGGTGLTSGCVSVPLPEIGHFLLAFEKKCW